MDHLIDKTKDPTKSDITKKAPKDVQMFSALSFAVMLVLVGIPLWWKTTEVYRVNLPYTEIDDLKTNTFKISFTLHLVTINKANGEKLAEDFSSYFDHSRVFNVTVKTHIGSKSLLGACKHLHDIDEKITHPKLEGNIQLMEVPGLIRFTPRNVIFGQNRTIYFSSEADSKLLLAAIEETLLQEDQLIRTVLHVRAPPVGKLDAASSRRVSPSASFDALITVLHPEPERMTIQFDITKAIYEYMDPLLHELKDLAKIYVKSQWLYLVNLQVNTKLVESDSSHYALPASSLPHVVTPLEKKLSSHVSARPCLNFVLWIPPCSSSPLHIYNEKGVRQTGHDAFLSPRWGGIQIFNPPKDQCELSDDVVVRPSSQQVMPVFVEQLRILLGIPSVDAKVSQGYMLSSKLSVRQWEKDILMRSRTVEQLTIAKRTLQSLSKLLGKISNIVINDNIGAAIYESLEAIIECEKALEAGKLLESYKLSQRAFLASETAFTDPSLLSLLYFPEDQKYAVYIPLFLPVMIPVLISFKPLRDWVTWKYFKSKEKSE